MPVREICQAEAVATAGAPNLCVHCCWKDHCPVPGLAAQSEELNGPLLHKRTLIVDCGGFLPTAEAGRLGIGKDGTAKRLRDAGVNDLCAECPSAKNDSCAHHARNRLVDLVAIRTGRGIRTATTCCSTVRDTIALGTPGEVLHQIDEPQAP